MSDSLAKPCIDPQDPQRKFLKMTCFMCRGVLRKVFKIDFLVSPKAGRGLVPRHHEPAVRSLGAWRRRVCQP